MVPRDATNVDEKCVTDDYTTTNGEKSVCVRPKGNEKLFPLFLPIPSHGWVRSGPGEHFSGSSWGPAAIGPGPEGHTAR